MRYVDAAAGGGRSVMRPGPWLAVASGWAIMFGATYWDLARTLWRSDEQFHGVVILLISIWLVLDRARRFDDLPARPRPAWGSALFALGWLLYVVGRSQDILMFEVGAQVPVLAGIVLMMHGSSAVRRVWFPLAFLLFMVPLPGVMVDAMTGPLKQWVSVIAEQALYAAGYPIARSGVMLSVGQYQLLVADACSGLNSMFSLSALGLLYLHLTGERPGWHRAVMIACILPVAFGANVLRVVALVLITYHLGDQAGQGFLHGFAGIAMLCSALGLMFILDGALIGLGGAAGRRERVL